MLEFDVEEAVLKEPKLGLGGDTVLSWDESGADLVEEGLNVGSD